MKYLWILCIIFVVKICGKEQFDEDSTCYVNCINIFNKTKLDNICQTKYNEAPTSEYIQDMNETIGISSPSIYCLTKDAFTVAWQPFNLKESLTYLVELRNRMNECIATNKTKSTNITFIDLEPDSKYQVKIWAFNLLKFPTTRKIFGPVSSPWVITFHSNFTPHPVRNISLKGMNLIEGKFQAVIQWTPDEDNPSCYYDVVLFHEQRVQQFEFRELAQPFEAKFNEIDLETNVTIIIRARNGDEESARTETYFFTPPCIEFLKNLSICAPETPTGLTAEENAIQIVHAKHLTYYDVIVKWNKPKYVPDNYTILLTSTNLHLNVTVPGNTTKYVFKNVEVGLHYLVALKAFSAGGESEPAIISRQSTHSAIADSNRFVWVTVIIGMTAISFFIFFGFGFCLFHRRAKRKRYERRCKYFEELDGKLPKSMDCITSGTGLILDEIQQEPDKWDIPVERLILQSILGEGAFGLVRRAWLKNEQGNASIEVAIKMLKDAPSADEAREFMHEIEIMKTVGAHPNLVSLIGCSRSHTNVGNSVMLVVEFCALGDLQNYLRCVWERITSPKDQQTLKYADLMSTNSEGSNNLIINKLYDIEASLAEINVKASDLLSFARQIAVGMEFLASMKVLHRDLAARNVLVCSDKTVKIADFGLSRDVYKENMYRKSSNGKLPIRWMAIESLTHQIYTSQSDVWSFGILLWEIVTLGGNPYPSIPTNALLKYLKSGYRMERPANCGLELYTIMLSCWKTRPKDRPTFTELKKSLDELLESVTTSKYLDLDVLNSNEFSSFRNPFNDSSSLSGKSRSKNSDIISSERYVHPILLNNVKNSFGNTDIPSIIK